MVWPILLGISWLYHIPIISPYSWSSITKKPKFRHIWATTSHSLAGSPPLFSEPSIRALVQCWKQSGDNVLSKQWPPGVHLLWLNYPVNIQKDLEKQWFSFKKDYPGKSDDGSDGDGSDDYGSDDDGSDDDASDDDASDDDASDDDDDDDDDDDGDGVEDDNAEDEVEDE